MTEFEFCSCVLHESVWVRNLKDSSFADRPKLMSAFRKLIRRAGDDLDDLGAISVFSPSENTAGLFLHKGFESPAIYLASSLDKHSQAEVDYCVAHEFAHAVAHATGLDALNTECICGAGEDCLCFDCECEGCHNLDLEMTPDEVKTPEEYVNFPPEYAADALVLKWGYKLPAWKAKVRVPSGSTPYTKFTPQLNGDISVPTAVPLLAGPAVEAQQSA